MDTRDEGTGDVVQRRTFLSWVTVALGSAAAAIAAVPPIVYVLGPVARRPPEEWRSVGALDDFDVGSTVEVVFSDPSPEPWAGESARMGAWLRRLSDRQFTAFSIDCTHLGCPVRWLKDAELFMCPCHGGVFYSDGEVAAGPPLEPLRHHPVRVREGRVEVRTRPIPLYG